jgi:hypothetical protein
MASQTRVFMEVEKAGRIADAILERLRGVFGVSDQHHLGQFEVLVADINSDAARQRIVAVAASVNLNWENHVHFVDA